MKKQAIEQRTEDLLLPILADGGYTLVDVEYVKEGENRYLRVYADKPGGITIGDCERISRALSPKLDEEDFIRDAYILEVSSPGLGRPLKKERDYAWNLGKEVELTTFQKIEGRKAFAGELVAYDKESFTIREKEKTLTFLYSQAARVREAVYF